MVTKEDYDDWNVENFPFHIINLRKKIILGKWAYRFLLFLAFCGVLFILSIVTNNYGLDLFKFTIEHKVTPGTMDTILNKINETIK